LNGSPEQNPVIATAGGLLTLAGIGMLLLATIAMLIPHSAEPYLPGIAGVLLISSGLFRSFGAFQAERIDSPFFLSAILQGSLSLTVGFALFLQPEMPGEEVVLLLMGYMVLASIAELLQTRALNPLGGVWVGIPAVTAKLGFAAAVFLGEIPCVPAGKCLLVTDSTISGALLIAIAWLSHRHQIRQSHAVRTDAVAFETLNQRDFDSRKD
jgi:uncharacterized membrane protein HdeD (DUF308 family)